MKVLPHAIKWHAWDCIEVMRYDFWNEELLLICRCLIREVLTNDEFLWHKMELTSNLSEKEDVAKNKLQSLFMTIFMCCNLDSVLKDKFLLKGVNIPMILDVLRSFKYMIIILVEYCVTWDVM